MGKVPYGVADKHIKCSLGPDVDLMKFYSTRYGTDYGRRWANFVPRTTAPLTGSGFVSNVRPQVFYSTRLDEVDNPPMGRICADNYSSITQRSFGPLMVPDGSEPLPNSVTQRPSGFVREKPLHIAPESEVQEGCIGSMLCKVPVDILPRYKPYLHQIQRKDPIENENCGYGPGCMTTETKTRFRGEQMERGGGKLRFAEAGTGKEETGFTHNHHVEPVTFHPDFAYKADYPAYMTSRPTGLSITKTHFQPPMIPNGMEPLPRIAVRSDKETGFTHGIKPKTAFGTGEIADAFDRAENQPPMKLERVRKEDPTEYINMTHPNNYSSTARRMLLGKQFPDESEAQRLGRLSVGRKEPTGYTSNGSMFLQTADNPARFITDNMTRFYDRTPVGPDRQGHVWGGTLPPQPGGFTRDVRVHTGAPNYNSSEVLRDKEPYVARSMRARDTYFDDHKYDSKLIQNSMSA